MRAFVRFRTPDGDSHELSHGDFIGRLWSAGLQLRDPRVSEMHAMVSLRGSAFRLLGLRGRLAVGAAPQTDIALTVGQQIAFADGLALEVEAIALPDSVLALEGDGLPRQALANTMSLVIAQHVELVSGFHPRAAAVIWSDGDRWTLQLDGEQRELASGDTFVIGSRRFSALPLELSASGTSATLASGVATPLHIVCRYDIVHIHRDGARPLALDGVSARIVSELAAVGQPIGWDALAREVWSDGTTAHLRKRWDVALVRLRKKLRDVGIRGDLLRHDGNGNVELFLERSDTIDEQT